MNKPELKVSPFWAVPLVEVRYPEPETLCAQLAELFLKRDGDPEYVNRFPRDTQHGALFESRFDLFGWPEEPVKVLAAFCHTAVASAVTQLNEYEATEAAGLFFEYHAWFHVTRRGGFQAVHNHPNASWSGIFCVDPGDALSDAPESGAVRFRSPYVGNLMYSDAGNERLAGPYAGGGAQIQHDAGKLILFPSYLEHEVFPYLGETPRITVAFNSWVKRQG